MEKDFNPALQLYETDHLLEPMIYHLQVKTESLNLEIPGNHWRKVNKFPPSMIFSS